MRNHMEAGSFYSRRQIGRYLATRASSLKPPEAKSTNPITILRKLNRHQWLMFACGFVAWVWDAFDYMALTEIAEDFGVANSQVSWGITVTLMLRSVGALIFGAFADRYGRKWPMVIDLASITILELGSSFCQTLPQFGIAMGGMYGPAASTALEDLPYESRGILSGIFQNGCSTGYLLVAIFYRAFVPTTSHSWRSLFWFASGPPVLIIIFRLMLPETNHFQVIKAEREARAAADAQAQVNGADQGQRRTGGGLRAFWTQAVEALKLHWVLLLYMVVFMAGFNSCSHGSQDFYPTYLKDQVGFGATDVTILSVVGQLGSIAGGTAIGYISTFTGRRLVMMIACIIGGALVPAYVIPRDMTLTAAVFFEQFFVGGVWGPIPIHLMELSPDALRTMVLGLTYQLGNLASSASATIQAIIGERYPLPDGPSGNKRFDYGRVIAIFLGAVWAYLFVFIFLGPEMSQEERNEIAEEARYLEGRRLDGTSMADIGTKSAAAIAEEETGRAKNDAGKVSVQHLA
ncbi:major facilitator superfamily domain-containing protein [Aspergillus keveii]|uniref:Major facilitator superfamily domain-containing protein n=1 Tax=Aspergillus keveii TaxID=714993 RepID=A0ABR4G6C8_9EURO